MKHIFSVHSPVTFLAAHAVVQNLKLDIEEVIILTKNYIVPLPDYKTYPTFSCAQSNFFKKVLNSNLPRFADKFLNTICKGDDFVAYIDLMSYDQRILVTNPRCKRFNFIEEGNSSYRDKDTLQDLIWDKRKFPLRSSNRIASMIKSVTWAYRGYTQSLLALPYSFSSYHDFQDTTFFGFSEMAYPQIPQHKKYVLHLEKNEELNRLAGNVSLKYDIIWVDGSNSRYTGLPESAYHDAIDRAIKLLHDELASKRVFVKFRPGLLNPHDQYLYKALQKNDFQVHVLSDELILECIFLNSYNCLVVGNLSSALFYAGIFGHRVYSLYSLFEKQPPTIFDQMPGYWKVVKRLTEG